MDANSFAFRLKELLEHRQLTLQAVANVLGVSRTAVHKWTHGGKIDETLLQRLADLLQVNWVWLRYGEQTQQQAATTASQSLPMTDVRRKYTAEIIESEARMQQALTNARIVTWEWSLLTDEVRYSSNVEQVYGWPINSNDAFWQHIYPQDVAPLQACYAQAFKDGQPLENDFRIVTPTGEIRWIASRATPICDAAGRVIKLLGISMDNSARMLAEEGLRANQDLLVAIGAGNWRYQRKTGLFSCDTATCTLLGKRNNARLNDLESLLTCLQADQQTAIRQQLEHSPNGVFRLTCRNQEDQLLQLVGKVSEDARQVFGVLLPA
jgi:PAS domain-containing protein